MEDFGNIVYVVAAIAWFAWNTYRKSQNAKQKPATASRPKRAQKQQQTEPAEAKSLEDVIMEQLGGSRPELKPEPVRYEPQTSANQDKFLNTDLTHSHLSNDYEMSQSENKSHRVERQVRKMEVDEDDGENESVIDAILPNGFDLRRAVVLNAILEKPYN